LMIAPEESIGHQGGPLGEREALRDESGLVPIPNLAARLHHQIMASDQATETPQTLLRPAEGRVFLGVAAALAAYFDLDVALVRIAFVVLGFAGGLAVPAYIAGWLFIPDEATGRASIDDYFPSEQAA
ncbi:MAG: PspC domain-containing protein, partial [Terriglobales bacterium]